MEQKRIVFHHPDRLDRALDGASRLRPLKMVKAFQDLGYQVDIIAGTGDERKRSIRKIKELVRNGVKYDFLYSESSTSPTLLTESHHLPIYPILDFGFFFWFRKKSGPVGLFYRDVYWRYPQYVDQIGIFKSTVGRIFHWLDLVFYKLVVDHIFLPSLRMRSALPFWLRPVPASGLPAGSEARPALQLGGALKLRLLYVGGILPPYYDIGPMIELAEKTKDFCELTICCRKQEWEVQEPRFGSRIKSFVNVVHLGSLEIENLYRNSDVFILFREPDPYLSFAMPYKVFEAISYGLPILTRPHEAVSDDIQSKAWGWVVDDVDEAVQALKGTSQNPGSLNKMRTEIHKSSKNESWEGRCKSVIQALLGDRI